MCLLSIVAMVTSVLQRDAQGDRRLRSPLSLSLMTQSLPQLQLKRAGRLWQLSAVQPLLRLIAQ